MAAAAKKTAKKAAKKRKRPRGRYFKLSRRRSPERRAWNLFMHDVDTLLHQLVRNPEHALANPAELVARAEAFADALHALSQRRRPPGLDEGDDF